MVIVNTQCACDACHDNNNHSQETLITHICNGNIRSLFHEACGKKKDDTIECPKCHDVIDLSSAIKLQKKEGNISDEQIAQVLEHLELNQFIELKKQMRDDPALARALQEALNEEQKQVEKDNKLAQGLAGTVSQELGQFIKKSKPNPYLVGLAIFLGGLSLSVLKNMVME